MKTWMWASAGVGVMMAAGVAVAQVPPAAAPGAPPGGPQGPRPGEMHGEMGPGGPHGWMRHAMEMHRPPSKAAHFRFRKGDSMVDIKCADDEPMKACVDASAALMDKLAAQPK